MTLWDLLDESDAGVAHSGSIEPESHRTVTANADRDVLRQVAPRSASWDAACGEIRPILPNAMRSIGSEHRRAPRQWPWPGRPAPDKLGTLTPLPEKAGSGKVGNP